MRCLYNYYARRTAHDIFVWKGKSFGKGPPVAVQAEVEKKYQNKRTKNYMESFKNDDFAISNGDDIFTPSKKAKHKAPDAYSLTNPLQENRDPLDISLKERADAAHLKNKKPVAVKCEHLTKLMMQKRKEITSQMKSQDVEVIYAQDKEDGSKSKCMEVPTINTCVPYVDPNPDNCLLLCFLHGFNIKRCYGCKKEFDISMRV